MGPGITIIGRAKNTDRSPGKNVPARIDGQSIRIPQTSYGLSPVVAVVDGAKNAATGSSKNVPTEIDSDRRDRKVRQASISFHPVFSIIGRTKNAGAEGPGKNVSARIDC